MVAAAHALVEAYSVLTRLPEPHCLSPAGALAELQEGFVTGVQVIALGGADYLALLRQTPAKGVRGGTLYDAIIMACARSADADVIVTFNEHHFAPFADKRLKVSVPAAT